MLIADITAIICSGESPFSSSIACSSFDLFVSSAAAGVLFFAKTLQRVSSVFAVSKLPIYRSVVARLLCPRIFLIADITFPDEQQIREKFFRVDFKMILVADKSEVLAEFHYKLFDVVDNVLLNLTLIDILFIHISPHYKPILFVDCSWQQKLFDFVFKEFCAIFASNKSIVIPSIKSNTITINKSNSPLEYKSNATI